MEEAAAGGASADPNCCYLCNQCPKSFASLADLEQHLGGAHGAADDCDDGQSHTSASSDVSARSFGADLVVKDEAPTTPPPPTAGAAADGATAVSSFACRLCPKAFGSRQLLSAHHAHSHRDRPRYECDVCFKVFVVKRELATHRRVHSGEQTHVCAQCGKEFGTRQLLKKHWMWHTGERSHVCPHCGKAFFQKGHLTQHLMIHAGGRPHVCRLCQKTFIFKFDLNRHMKIHAERGFACNRCGAAFLKQSALSNHEVQCRARRPSPPVVAAPAVASPPPPPPVSIATDDRVDEATSPAVQTFPPASPAVPTPTQPFVCFLCMKPFSSQAACTLHLSYVHFKNFAPAAQVDGTANQGESSAMANLFSSLQFVAPAAEKGEACDDCARTRRQLAELERRAAAQDGELRRLRETMRGVSAVAGGLLDSCSDFDKLWMLHSKKVYTQIQSILNKLD